MSESMNWREALVLTAVAAALLGIGVVTAEAQWNHSARFLDQKNLGDLFSGLQAIAANPADKRKLATREFKDKVGRGFFEACFKTKVLESDLTSKCVSLRSFAGDIPGDPAIADGEAEFTQANCSYATPKGHELLQTLNKRGKSKCIALCFDSRNWLNGGKSGVLVSWTDGEQAAYLDAKTLMNDLKISAEDLGDPGAKVLGKLSPFDHVFEEDASNKASAKVRELVKTMPSYVEVFRKTGRSWKYRVTQPEGSKYKNGTMSVTITDVSGDTAKFKYKMADADGNEQSREETMDLSDDLDQRPPGKADDADEEVEVAGKKWKCRLWTFVDVGKVTVKNWMSVEYPGLVVKSVGHNTVELIEFHDPK